MEIKITEYVICRIEILLHIYNAVLGKLPPKKIAPSPNSNANPKPNPDPDRGAIFRTPYNAQQTK